MGVRRSPKADKALTRDSRHVIYHVMCRDLVSMSRRVCVCVFILTQK